MHHIKKNEIDFFFLNSEKKKKSKWKRSTSIIQTNPIRIDVVHKSQSFFFFFFFIYFVHFHFMVSLLLFSSFCCCCCLLFIFQLWRLKYKYIQQSALGTRSLTLLFIVFFFPTLPLPNWDRQYYSRNAEKRALVCDEYWIVFGFVFISFSFFKSSLFFVFRLFIDRHHDYYDYYYFFHFISFRWPFAVAILHVWCITLVRVYLMLWSRLRFAFDRLRFIVCT